MPDRDQPTKFPSVCIKICSTPASGSGASQKDGIPAWNTYFPSLDNATHEQRRFYEYWSVETEKGRRIDIQGNLSYAFVHLYAIIEGFINDKKLDRLLARFDKVRDACSNYDKITEAIGFWTGDAYLLLGDYDRAWHYLKGSYIRISDVTSLRSKCGDTSIEGDTLIRLTRESGSLLTKFGKEHRSQVAELATLFLQDFHRENGQNFIEYFCRQFDFSNLTDREFSKLRAFYSNDNEFLMWKTDYEDQKAKSWWTYAHYLFPGVPLLRPDQRVYIKFDRVPYIIEVAALNEAKRIIRESENTLRTEFNLPKVGEGWIAETELYNRMRDAFPNEKVVHHGRPSWLGQHHLDIYFPLKGIGIEYQGAQHQNPVDYFGGEDAFKKQQERDKKKLGLCKKNGCKLIYVYERYDFEEVKRTILEALGNSTQT